MKSTSTTFEVYPAAFVRTTHRPRRRISELRLWAMEKLTQVSEKNLQIAGACRSAEGAIENNTHSEMN